MSNEILKRDEDHTTVGAAVTNDSDQDVTMLRVDAVTKYLLVEVSASGAAVGAVNQIAKRDQNHVPVCLAWNEQDQELQEVLTDSNGYLLVDII